MGSKVSKRSQNFLEWSRWRQWHSSWTNTYLAIGSGRKSRFRITQPCLYLEKLLDQPGLYKRLWDNGGISCEILSDGIINRGDIITVDRTQLVPK